MAKFCASCVPMMLLRKDMEMTTSSSGGSKGDCGGAKLESLLVDVHHRLDDLLRDDKYGSRLFLQHDKVIDLRLMRIMLSFIV